MSEAAFIRGIVADRIGGANYGKDGSTYKFAAIKRVKAEARLRHPEIELIDLGVGEPDEMADNDVIAVLAKEAVRRENRGYADNGCEEFKEAAAAYMERVFAVRGLNPTTDILHSIGSKSAAAMLPFCFINPGDVFITTSPGYPIPATHTRYLGGEVYAVPLVRENGFLPDFESIPASICKRAKLLYLNYPNNPTGACANRTFFEQVVDFCSRNGIMAVHDAAYAALTYDGEKPLSFLSVPGAREVGIELHSLSKSFSMTGWRIGFTAGNPLVIKLLGDVKDNCDSGQFLAVQKAAAYALRHPEITARAAAKYSRRLGLMAEALGEIGFRAEKPKGSFFLYAEAPIAMADGSVRFSSAEQFCACLLRKKLISAVPWDDAGSFVRFSATFAADTPAEELRLIGEMKRRLAEMKLIFA
jgi:LL-diaminopimelate aminotransferase